MPVELWSSPAFHAEVGHWVEGAARGAGIRLSGEFHQPHNRPWSSAIRFGSDAGPLWFKVNGPGTLHEGALVAALGQLQPELVSEVLAIDRERGWWLTRDAGPILRTVAAPGELWTRWEAILPRYGRAQLRLASQVDALLATGVQEVSPATLPGQFQALLDHLSERSPAEGGLTSGESQSLAALLPLYQGWCDELAQSGIPNSIQHDDLHSANVCWGGSAGRARIIDWGDASVGYPLGTMLSTLNSIAHHAKIEVEDSRVQRMRDAYLEPFTHLASRERLVALVRVARRLGCVTRALSYVRAFEGEPTSAESSADFPVRGWLLELLAD